MYKLLHLPAGSACPPAPAGKLSHLPGASQPKGSAAAAKAETGENLKVRAGKTAPPMKWSTLAPTRKVLHLPVCPAESADISKPTAEKASTAQWSTTERTPASESAETQTPPPRLPAKAEKH